MTVVAVVDHSGATMVAVTVVEVGGEKLVDKSHHRPGRQDGNR